MFGLVMCQLFSTRVRSSPFFGSRWSQSKQITFRWASVRDSSRSLTTDSGPAGAAGSAEAAGHATSATPAQAGTAAGATTESAAAPLAPRKARRDRPLSCGGCGVMGSLQKTRRAARLDACRPSCVAGRPARDPPMLCVYRSAYYRPERRSAQAFLSASILMLLTFAVLYSLPESSFLVTGSPSSVAVIFLSFLRSLKAALYSVLSPVSTQRVPSSAVSMISWSFTGSPSHLE